MTQFWIKTCISALLIAGISELGKRYPLFGGLLASLPITSVLAFIWLYGETHNTQNVAELSGSILWMVLPSLILFLALPFLLKRNIPFFPALLISCTLTAIGYSIMLALLKKFSLLP